MFPDNPVLFPSKGKKKGRLGEKKREKEYNLQLLLT